MFINFFPRRCRCCCSSILLCSISGTTKLFHAGSSTSQTLIKRFNTLEMATFYSLLFLHWTVYFLRAFFRLSFIFASNSVCVYIGSLLRSQNRTQTATQNRSLCFCVDADFYLLNRNFSSTNTLKKKQNLHKGKCLRNVEEERTKKICIIIKIK